MSKIESVVRGATITDVSTRLVSNGTRTLWEVYTQDGTKWTTFHAAVGNKAIALKGQLADLKVSIEQKDQYTNYYVNEVQPAAGGPGVSTPVQAPVQQPSPVLQAAEQARQAQGEVSFAEFASVERENRAAASEREKERNESIHRQVAAKVSGQISDNPSDFWANVQDLFVYFQTGTLPSNVTSHAALVADAPLPDDDIPF